MLVMLVLSRILSIRLAPHSLHRFLKRRLRSSFENLTQMIKLISGLLTPLAVVKMVLYIYDIYNNIIIKSDSAFCLFPSYISDATCSITVLLSLVFRNSAAGIMRWFVDSAAFITLWYRSLVFRDPLRVHVDLLIPPLLLLLFDI